MLGSTPLKYCKSCPKGTLRAVVAVPTPSFTICTQGCPGANCGELIDLAWFFIFKCFVDCRTLDLALITYNTSIALFLTTVIMLPSLSLTLGISSSQRVRVSTFNFALALTPAQFSTMVR